MTQETNLHFDIDALFDHLISNLGHDLGETAQLGLYVAVDRCGSAIGSGARTQRRVATQLQEEVEEIDEEGERTSGQRC